MPTARVAYIGLYREPQTFVAMEYFFKSPADLGERLAIVMSPVLATGNTATAAIDRLKERSAKDIRMVCVIAAPEGFERARGLHSDLPLWTAAIDEDWTTTPSSCPASATPAIAPAAHGEAPRHFRNRCAQPIAVV